MSTIPQIIKESRSAMEKSLESSKRELGSIRTGKASTSLLDTVRVEAYGQSMPLNQVASVSAPEPRLLTVTPRLRPAPAPAARPAPPLFLPSP